MAVGEGLIRSIVLARSDGKTVLRGSWRSDRIRVDLSIGVRVTAFVSGRKADQDVAMGVDEVVAPAFASCALRVAFSGWLV